MTPPSLLSQFDRWSDVPNAIPRIRRFLLDLAVRGKLAEQDPADEPPSALLQLIEKDVSERKAAGMLSESRRTIDISADSLPFAVRPSWRWTRLIDVADVSYGFAFASSRFNSTKTGMPLIRIRDISNEDTQAYYDGDFHDAYLVHQGDYLVGMDGDFNLRRWRGPDALLNQRVMRIRNWHVSLVPEFLAIPLQMILDHLHGSTSLTTVKHLSAKQVNGIYLPFTSTAEQQRIMARLDELMKLCDDLEAAQTERESSRDRLASASTSCLNETTGQPSFTDKAGFYLEALACIVTRAEHVQELRETILDRAIRGQLVQQQEDEPASKLLKRIRHKRELLRAEKKIPRPKLLPKIREHDLLFAVPSGWEWTMLGELCYQVADGPHFSPTYVPAGEGVPFLSTRNVRVDRFDLSDVKYVSQEDHETFSKRIRPERGDIIYTKGGTTGIARVNDLDFEFSVWVHLAVLKVAKELLDPRYVALALNSPVCYAQSQTFTRGTSNFDLGLTRMINILLPLPPFPEQERIVACVDELMALCDELEESLTNADTQRSRLLEAVLHEALESVA